MKIFSWIKALLTCIYSWLSTAFTAHLEERVHITTADKMESFSPDPRLLKYPINRREAITWIINEHGGKILFSLKFGIPIKTVEDWLAGRRLPKIYLILMLQNLKYYEEKDAYTTKLLAAIVDDMKKGL